jgi:hypothetical protein
MTAMHGARPQTTRAMRPRSPCACAGAGFRKPRSLRRRCGRPVPCCGVGCLSPGNGRSY